MRLVHIDHNKRFYDFLSIGDINLLYSHLVRPNNKVQRKMWTLIVKALRDQHISGFEHYFMQIVRLN